MRPRSRAPGPRRAAPEEHPRPVGRHRRRGPVPRPRSPVGERGPATGRGVVAGAVGEVVAVCVAASPEDPLAPVGSARHRAASREGHLSKWLPAVGRWVPAGAVVEAVPPRLAAPDAQLSSRPGGRVVDPAGGSAVTRERLPSGAVPAPGLTQGPAGPDAPEDDCASGDWGHARKAPRDGQREAFMGSPAEGIGHGPEATAPVVAQEVGAARRERRRRDENQEAERCGHRGRSSFSTAAAFRTR